MEITYDSITIENVVNALNKLQVVGIANAEILTFVVQQLGTQKILKNNEAGVTDGN